MKNNKKAENIIAVIIAVFILSFALLGIINILSFNHDVNEEYQEEIWGHIIEWNIDNLLEKVDIDAIQDNETFYIYKNTASGSFETKTWSANSDFQYIDIYGENIANTLDNQKVLYSQELIKKVDILRQNISPDEVPNLIFHLDATNVDGTNNSSISNNDPLSSWTDLSGNNIHFIQPSTSQSATFQESAIFSNPVINFDGVNDIYILDGNNDGALNSDTTISGQTYYYDGVHPLVNKNHHRCNWVDPLVFREKSLAIVLRTWSDVNSSQMIYEQWGVGVGYNFTVANGNIYAWIHNRWNGIEGCYNYDDYVWSGWDVRSVNLWEAIPNTIYFIMITHDATHADTSLNSLKIYMNGELADSQYGVEAMPRHHKVGLGWVIGSNIEPYGSFDVISCPWWDACGTMHWVETKYKECKTILSINGSKMNPR